ncbi:MAG: thioredoxin family protein [Tepidisphaera sp.]|jgi:thioredoxin-like negative regulator of GroEL
MANLLRSSAPALLAIVGGLAVVSVLRTTLGGGGVAPVPAAFESGLSLDEAISQGTASGRPVIAFATADWCPPCQTMKRSTLTDLNVEAFLKGRAISVYVDVDRDRKAAERLGVTGIPATVIIAGDTVVSRISGVMSPSDYLSFLTASVDLANNPAEVERLRNDRPR